MKLFLLATLENTTDNNLFVHPKKCITIVFSFSWDLESSQEKLKTMLMQYFFFGGGGGGTKILLSGFFLKWRIELPNPEEAQIWEGEDESVHSPQY